MTAPATIQPASPSRPSALRLRELIALIALYGAATIACGLLFAGVMRSGVLDAFSVMFYRGLMALAAAAAVTLGAALVLAPRLALSGRDAFGAAMVAAALNLAVFTLGPVTVDRSISVFMLSRFERADALTAQAARDAFVTDYVDGWRQIERRIDEQVKSGNLQRTQEGWRLTAQGRRFMDAARTMSRWFKGDPRFVGRDGD